MTPADLLQRELRRDGARPLVTWYDDAAGERVELSVATAANWAAKTANLLADEHGLEPGATLRLVPADHWLSVVVVLGAWTAGVTVVTGDAAVDVTLPQDAAAFMRAVLPQPDALLTAPAAPETPALAVGGTTWTLAEAAAAPARLAAPERCRVLSTLGLDTLAGFEAAVLLPLAAGGSVVLIAHSDPARLAGHAATERATHTAGADVTGLPRLL